MVFQSDFQQGFSDGPQGFISFLLLYSFLEAVRATRAKNANRVLCSRSERRSLLLISTDGRNRKKEWDNIYIDEGQFFQGLKDFVIKAAELDDKNITICGLDGDFNRETFGEIIDLIPYSDSICKLTAICSICRNGTPAIFSKKIVNDDSQIINVGALDKYIAVCRKHYLKT